MTNLIRKYIKNIIVKNTDFLNYGARLACKRDWTNVICFFIEQLHKFRTKICVAAISNSRRLFWSLLSDLMFTCQLTCKVYCGWSLSHGYLQKEIVHRGAVHQQNHNPQFCSPFLLTQFYDANSRLLCYSLLADTEESKKRNTDRNGKRSRADRLIRRVEAMRSLPGNIIFIHRTTTQSTSRT